MAENRVRIRCDQNVVTTASIELRGDDGEYHDVRACVRSATVTLEVGALSRAHLDVILVDSEIEAFTIDDETLDAFAHNLRLAGWTVEPPVAEAAA